VSSAIDIIIKHGIINNIYNIGTKNEYSVLDIAINLINILKPNEDINNWIEYVDDRLFNDFRYAINNDKIISLGWKEEHNFDEYLLKTIEYYKILYNNK
jgi:dTDP-D-glucose 4,6-dehydratase